MDNFAPNVDSNAQLKNDSNLLRWLSGVFTSIRREEQIRQRVLYQFAGAAGLAANTNEQSLGSCTIPAGNFLTVGSCLKLTAVGQAGNNTNNKRLRLYLGGILQVDPGYFAYNVPWRFDAMIVCLSTTSQILTGTFCGRYNTLVQTALDFQNSNQILQLTGQSQGGVLSDLILNFFELTYSGNL